MGRFLFQVQRFLIGESCIWRVGTDTFHWRSGLESRRIPRHREGHRIIGNGNLLQIGTLIERTTLFVALVKLTSR